MIFLFSIPLAAAAFIFESYPRFVNREYGVDIWTHLIYLKEFKKQKKMPVNMKNGFIFSGDYDYPPVFMWILSKLPFRLVEKYEFLFSPFFDSIHLILIFLFAYMLTSSIYIAFLTQALYVLTPIIILENSSATPRSLGYTLFTIVMMSIFFYQNSGNMWLLILAIVSGALIFLTHRFTTQGFLFFAIIFGVLEKSLLFPSIFLVSFVLALVFSKGFYWKVLNGHLGNLMFWKKNIEHRYAHQVKGNLSPKKTKDFIFRIYTQFLKFPPFVLEITNPWILFTLIFILFNLNDNFIISSFVLWITISYGLAIATMWIPFLRFLGEGQRYLELSAFPTAFIAAYVFVSSISTNWETPIVFAYTLVGITSFVTILIIQRKAIINEKLRTLTPDMKKMFLYLRSMKRKPRLLCIPHQITTNTIYHTGCFVYVNASYKTINEISDVYPFIKKPISEIMKKNNLDFILLNTEYASIEELGIENGKIKKQIKNFSLIGLT